MPQESQSSENNKPKQRFGGRRRSFVDTFRWGFVPDEDSANQGSGNVAPKSAATPKSEAVKSRAEQSRAEQPRAEKTNTRKSATKKTGSTAPVENSVPDSAPDSAPQQKRGRQQKRTAKTAEAKPQCSTTQGSTTQCSTRKAAAKTKSDEEKGGKHSSKTPAGHLPKQSVSEQSVAGKRPSKQSKKRAKIALSPYATGGDYDENDEDLKLPSYGRTPIPTDDELPVPQPIVRKKAAPSKSGGHTPPDEVPSDVSSVGFRLRREQMVWDPDKSEYVPLVIVKELEPPASKKPTKQRQTADSRQQTADSRRQTAEKPEPGKRRERTEKSLEKPKAERLPRPPKPQRPQVAPQEEKSESVEDQQDNRSTERPQRQGDSRRNRPPRFVDTHKPDPADIEAEVSGFAELGVSEAMLEALRIVRYLNPTPIQAGVFQKVQAGTDLMGQARTGTGKTAAFSMPIIEGVEMCPPGNNPVALILVPTRELAVQVRDEAMRLAYGRDIRITACYGGKPLAKQIERLRHGIDILVGTPGRILDLMNRRALSLDSLRWVVLDEADRMLDIGFRPDIEKILKRTPADRQTLLFSATLPPPVVRLAERYMKSPEVLDFSDKSVAVETIDQYYVTVDPERKFDALVYLLKEQEPQQAIIFTRTKRGADRLARLLSNRFEKLAAIHGDLQQSERDSVMAKVRAGAVRYLVATDVVGRGIDVTGISHIINYDIPKFCDDYVHRVGRTGRMGREGIAFTFVTVQEGSELTRIEMRIDKLLKRAELKGFESFTKPHDPNASLDEDLPPEPPKPVFGKPVRKVRRAL